MKFADDENHGVSIIIIVFGKMIKHYDVHVMPYLFKKKCIYRVCRLDLKTVPWSLYMIHGRMHTSYCALKKKINIILLFRK